MPVTILPFVQKMLIRYVMSIYLVLGITGNLCNCMVFLQRSHRNSPSSIYFLGLSVFFIIYLFWAVVPLIYTLEHVDPQTQLLAYCKMRIYGSHVLGLIVRFLVVFACADRYFSTRTSIRVRSWSSFRVARNLSIIMIVMTMLVGIHLIIYMDIRSGVCGMFDAYKLFYSIYQFILIGILPPVLMSSFSFTTIYSLHRRHDVVGHDNQTHIRRKDRDLMRMLIAEVMINIFTSIPYSANLLYGAATFFVVGKSVQRLEIESFLTFFSQFLIYLLEVAPFYLFIGASKSFRQEFKQIIIKLWYKYIRRRAQIGPINT